MTRTNKAQARWAKGWAYWLCSVRQSLLAPCQSLPDDPRTVGCPAAASPPVSHYPLVCSTTQAAPNTTQPRTWRFPNIDPCAIMKLRAYAMFPAAPVSTTTSGACSSFDSVAIVSAPRHIQIMRPVPQPRPNTKPTKPALKALTQAHKHTSYLDVHAAKSGENLGFGHSTARVCRWISQVSGAELAIFCGGETLSDSTHQLKCDTIYAAHVAVSAI